MNVSFWSCLPTSVSTTGATVTCRVCEEQIELNGRDNQHVVKCSACHEATPIRPAPAGKKYVRCPCNCLLICKVASTRIACPRGNCRRVITLGHREPQGSAIRAPAGSCRVQCVHCSEIFLFNTLSNCLAHCPHCKKNSTVGGFARRRALIYLVTAVTALLFSVLLTIMTTSTLVSEKERHFRKQISFYGRSHRFGEEGLRATFGAKWCQRQECCMFIYIIFMSRAMSRIYRWSFSEEIFASQHPIMYGAWALAYLVVLYLSYNFIKFWMVKLSTVLGPI